MLKGIPRCSAKKVMLIWSASGFFSSSPQAATAAVMISKPSPLGQLLRGILILGAGAGFFGSYARLSTRPFGGGHA